MAMPTRNSKTATKERVEYLEKLGEEALRAGRFSWQPKEPVESKEPVDKQKKKD